MEQKFTKTSPLNHNQSYFCKQTAACLQLSVFYSFIGTASNFPYDNFLNCYESLPLTNDTLIITLRIHYFCICKDHCVERVRYIAIKASPKKPFCST